MKSLWIKLKGAVENLMDREKQYQKLKKMSAEAWDETLAASKVLEKARGDYDEKFQKALAIDEELRWRTEKYT